MREIAAAQARAVDPAFAFGTVILLERREYAGETCAAYAGLARIRLEGELRDGKARHPLEVPLVVDAAEAPRHFAFGPRGSTVSGRH